VPISPIHLLGQCNTDQSQYSFYALFRAVVSDIKRCACLSFDSTTDPSSTETTWRYEFHETPSTGFYTCINDWLLLICHWTPSSWCFLHNRYTKCTKWRHNENVIVHTYTSSSKLCTECQCYLVWQLTLKLSDEIWSISIQSNPYFTWTSNRTTNVLKKSHHRKN
jgi:hypothetical protein